MFLIKFNIKTSIARILKIGTFLITIISMFFIWFHTDDLNSIWFYHSFSYKAGEYSIWIRMILIFLAVSWCTFLFAVIPNKNVPYITVIGQHTLPVFLLHGFVVKWLNHINLLRFAEPVNLLLALILTTVICVAFGNRVMLKIVLFSND